MKTKIPFFLTIISLFVSLLSCKKENEHAGTPALIQPLGIGYFWEYVDSTFTDKGVFTRVDTSKLGITGRIEVEYEGENLQLYLWNWFDHTNNEYQGNKWLCNNDKEGFCFYGGESGDHNFIFKRSLNKKYPVKADESWDVINYVFGKKNDSLYCYINDTLSYTCKSINETFLTKKGPVKCFKYQQILDSNGTIEEVNIYNSLNIGYVGLIRVRNGITIYKKSLLSYSLKDSPESPKSGIQGIESNKSPYE